MKIDVKKLERDSSEKLRFRENPSGDAKELVRHFFGMSELDVIVNPVAEISGEKLSEFNAAVEKRALGYPLQYIINEWDFLDRTFYIDENVLCPRTETEQVADEAVKYLRKIISAKITEKPFVADMCCGSGCIGLTVAAEIPQAEVVLCDISEKALDCAEINRKKFGLENCRLFKYDVFSGFDEKLFKPFDAFLSNPPYVPDEEMEKIQTEVKYEPKIAVDGGKGGMRFYSVLCLNWIEHLKKGGFFMFESGEGQPEKILDMIDKNKFDAKSEADICSVVRFVNGIKNK